MGTRTPDLGLQAIDETAWQPKMSTDDELARTHTYTGNRWQECRDAWTRRQIDTPQLPSSLLNINFVLVSQQFIHSMHTHLHTHTHTHAHLSCMVKPTIMSEDNITRGCNDLLPHSRTCFFFVSTHICDGWRPYLWLPWQHCYFHPLLLLHGNRRLMHSNASWILAHPS